MHVTALQHEAELLSSRVSTLEAENAAMKERAVEV